MMRRTFAALLLFGVLSSGTLFAQGVESPIAPGEHVALLNGVRLWYAVAGQKRDGQAPLVYLHGGPGYNSYSFQKTAGARLEKHVQMVYLDERGSGRSERPPDRDYTMAALVSDLEALRKQLGVEQISLMGHSFGGTIALEYAARYPKHVQKLVIVDGATDMPTTFALWRREIEQRYPEAWKSALAGNVGDRLRKAENGSDACALAKAEFGAEMTALQSVNSQQFHDWQQFHMQRYKREQNRLDRASGLSNTGEFGAAYLGAGSTFPCYRFETPDRLTMPTLLIVGRFDGAIGMKPMRSLARQLPRERLEVFAESAHFPYAEQSSKFARDVSEFLATR